MPDEFLEAGEALDKRRSQRARELSDLKTRMANNQDDPFDLNSKAVIVLTYSHWEGYYNDCVLIYIDFLRSLKLKVIMPHWLMLVGSLETDFARLRDRNHSYEAKTDFVDALKGRMEAKFDIFDAKCLMARSNLDFEKVRTNFRILGFDVSPLLRFRNRLDKELISWRHNVAHGNSPELSNFDIERHVDFTSDLLLTLSDTFQQRMLDVDASR